MKHNPSATDWTAYWASGALHSCVGSFRGIYEGAIQSFWRSAWIQHIRPGDRILDLGCGNGPLALLLLNEAPDWGSYLGIDLAAISPGWHSQMKASNLERIQFRGRTSMTQTEQPSGSFDWLVSQFGVEYADPTAWVPEVSRVLSDTPNLVLFLHHAQSRLVMAAREEVAHADWLFSEGGLMTIASTMIEPMALSRSIQGRKQLERSAQARQARERFNAAQDELDRRAAESPIPDLLFQAREACAEILGLAQTQGVASAQQAWTHWRRATQEARARQAELVSAALDTASAESLMQQLLALRPSLLSRLVPISEGRYLLGWGLSIHSQRSQSACRTSHIPFT